MSETKGAETGSILPHGILKWSLICFSIVGTGVNYIRVEIFYCHISGEFFKFVGRMKLNFTNRIECGKWRAVVCVTFCLCQQYGI